MESKQAKLEWSSRFVFIMACVGGAVGLGNIWMFPYKAGSNGGGAFVLIYIAAVIILALPVCIAELMIGRRGGGGPPNAIAKVAQESGQTKNWRWMGVILAGVGAVFALSFYSVVGAWTVAFAVKTASGQMANMQPEQIKTTFNLLNNNTTELYFWFCIFIGLTVYISSRGLHKGLEQAVRLMMPALFFMLVIMVIYAAIKGDFSSALRFLFNPDFSKLTPQVILTAFGQAFFSVSVGLTNLVAYGAYLRKDVNISRDASIIVGADSLVAILAGLAVFPIIFANNIEPSSGPGLVFQALPIAFSQTAGGLIFGALFFVLLFFAALTSSIAMIEAPVSWLCDETRLSRRMSAITVGFVGFLLGSLAALSFNVLSDIRPIGGIDILSDKGFFDLFAFIASDVIMPLGGLMIAVFSGWVVKRRFSLEELFEGKENSFYKTWLFLVRYVVPVLLVLLFYQIISA